MQSLVHIFSMKVKTKFAGLIVFAFVLLPSAFAQIPFSLQSHSGYFVAAEGGGGGPLNCDRKMKFGWELHGLNDINGGDLMDGDPVTIMAENRQYWVAEWGGNDVMNANRDHAFPMWETFNIVKVDRQRGIDIRPEIRSGNRIALRTFGGYFVTVVTDGGRLMASSTTIGDNESFSILFNRLNSESRGFNVAVVDPFVAGKGVIDYFNPNEKELNFFDWLNMVDFGAKTLRWQLVITADGNTTYLTSSLYRNFIERQVTFLKRVLPDLRTRGASIIIDIHDAPGPKSSKSPSSLFLSRSTQLDLMWAWDRISKEFSGQDGIVAFDLLNEPLRVLKDERTGKEILGKDCKNWFGLAQELIDIIRRNDPRAKIPILIEPQEGKFSAMNAIRDLKSNPNVVFSVHEYGPYVAVRGHSANNAAYPGQIWNRSKIFSRAAQIASYAKNNGLLIHVGELGFLPFAFDQGREVEQHKFVRDWIEALEANSIPWASNSFDNAGFGQYVKLYPFDPTESPLWTTYSLFNWLR